jgi:putative heme-binding domain-containing protein
VKKLVFLLCWTTGLIAQTGEIRNPRTSPEDVAAGALIFRSHCAECHGLHGEGGRGANLAGGTFYHGSTDADLLRNISEGIPGTEMPGTFFSDNQVWQMVSFVRSLSERAIETRVAGDPAAGEPLFRGKGGCARCHKVDGKGGRLGPDLSNVGSSRSLKHLREALEKPDSEVLPAFWRVSVTNRSGKSYSGFRLNEDTYSIQVLDMEERLHSFSKKDLQSLKIEKTSVMPSYASVFSDRELDNLLAYLSSLRRKARTQ